MDHPRVGRVASNAASCPSFLAFQLVYVVVECMVVAHNVSVLLGHMGPDRGTAEEYIRGEWVAYRGHDVEAVDANNVDRNGLVVDVDVFQANDYCGHHIHRNDSIDLHIQVVAMKNVALIDDFHTRAQQWPLYRIKPLAVLHVLLREHPRPNGSTHKQRVHQDRAKFGWKTHQNVYTRGTRFP